MDDLNFERISIEKGLSQSIIYSICQDSKGFIWFATQDGLNRFDGYNFKVYKNNRDDSKSLPINYISALYEDKEGILWIGGMNDNLSMYDKLNDNFVNFKLDKDPDIPGCSVITSILEDSNEVLWIGTCDGGLKKYNKKINSVEHLLKKNDDELCFKVQDISCLFKDNKENVWIGTMSEGLYCYEKKTNSVLKYSDLLNLNDSLTSNNITAIFEDHNYNMWIGTNNGLNFIDTMSNCLKKYFYTTKEGDRYRISAITQDKNKTLWIGTKNNGLIKFKNGNDHKAYKFDSSNLNSISSNSVYSLYIDLTNTLWIGTVAAGLNKIDCEKKLFNNITKVKSKSALYEIENVRTVCKDKMNRLWIGTSKNGVYVLAQESDCEKKYKKQINHLHQLINKNISRIIEDSKGVMWFTSFSEGTLIKYDEENNNYKSFAFDAHDAIHSTVIYKNNILLGSSSKGIINFQFQTESFEEFKPELSILNNITRDRMFCMLLDGNNILWIGTQNEGLYKINFENLSLVNFRHNKHDPFTLSDNFITCLYMDEYETLWVGTYSGGLNKLEKEKDRFTHYGLKQGLNHNIKGILEDQNNRLWMSSYDGLYLFNHKDNSIRNFDFTDGLQSNEFNDGAYFKDKDGTMYFGGINGVTYFNPSDIKDNPYIPNVVLTDFEIFNESVTGGPDNPFLKKNITYSDEINLSYRESVFSFRFAALIFNNPQKNQYAYKMEGFDKDWTYCGTRKRVTYTNLNPGDYVFRVKGSNNDGVWNEEGTSVKIHISPPYWKTVWFKGLSLLSLVGAVGLAYRQRLEKLEKEGKAQEEFSRKLIEVQESEKKRIADDLHDTIAHEILMSKQKAMMALKHKDDKDRMEKTLEEISELTSATITEVRNIAYGLHPHQLDRLGFTKTIKSIINEVSRSTSIKCVFETDNVDELLPKESEINLFRVIQETITNIIKHSQATEVILKVSKLEDHILILLIDNGKGMNLKGKEFINAKSGFGISTIAERLKIMDGEVSIDSEVNKGTTLRFRIPLRKV